MGSLQKLVSWTGWEGEKIIACYVVRKKNILDSYRNLSFSSSNSTLLCEYACSASGGKEVIKNETGPNLRGDFC